MKEIKAYVRVFMIENVVRALRHEGYRRMTILDVSATNEPLWREERQLSPEIGLHSRVAKLELLCSDEEVEPAVRVIRASAHTGNPGDGLICVSPVEQCLSIRTGLPESASRAGDESAGGGDQATVPETGNRAERSGGSSKVIDPVCGMEISREAAYARTEHMGQTYHFCAPSCQNRFMKEPERYVQTDEP